MKVIFRGKAALLWRNRSGAIGLAYPDIWRFLEDIRHDRRSPSRLGYEGIPNASPAIIVLFFEIEEGAMVIYNIKASY